MDNLTFWAKIAEILGSMAWPALVAAVLVAYRGHVAGLFDRITELTLPGGTKAVFKKELENAGEKAAEIESEAGMVAPTPLRPDDSFTYLAKNFPQAAIIEEFKEIEEIALEVGEALGLAPRAGRIDIPVQRLLDLGLIDDNAYDLFISLRRARNAAAHSRVTIGIESVDALEYRQNAELMKQILERALGKLREKNLRT
jgi:hypothetical protein